MKATWKVLGKWANAMCGTLLLFAASGALARAGSVTFDFNSLSSYSTAAQITTYMNSVLAPVCTGCTVVVTGAVADQTYNGEGNVVGPGTGSKSLTLGDTEHATVSNSSSSVNGSYDTFIANTNDGSTQVSNQITMKFSGFTLNGAAGFDYEIFPDGSSGQPPDFIFDINGSTPVSSFGTNGVQYGVTPGTTPIGSTKSPNGTQTNAQYIGTWSGSLSSASELDFIDWPATIGVDNLSITWNTPAPVPEPASVLLLAGVAAFALRKKMRRA